MPAVPGTYVRDGQTAVARTRAEAVELQFNGWRAARTDAVQNAFPAPVVEAPSSELDSTDAPLEPTIHIDDES